MKTIFRLIPLFFVLISCTSASTFSQFDTMPQNNRWEKLDSKVYEFEVDDSKNFYTIIFKFSHVYDYQFTDVPIKFTIESPDREKETLAVDLPIKDSNGKQLGNCSGDICDLKYLIKSKTQLQKGKYKITVSHAFVEAEYLPNVIGVGLNVDSEKQ